jgi:hypothetical protein
MAVFQKGGVAFQGKQIKMVLASCPNVNHLSNASRRRKDCTLIAA